MQKCKSGYRILYVNHETFASGATVHRDEFLNAAMALGAEIVPHRHSSVTAGEEAHSVNLRQSLKQKFYKKWTELSLILITMKHALSEWRSIRQVRPDVIFVNFTTHISSVLLARIKRIPVVLQIHCPHYLHASYAKERLRLVSFWKWIEKKAIDNASGVIVVSRLLEEYYVELGFPREKFAIAPNGVNPSRFNPHLSGKAIRERLGWQDALVIGFVGIIDYWSGMDKFLEFLARLKPFPNNLKLMIIGAGQMEPQLREIVAREHLEGIVEFTGFVPHEEIPEYIAGFDIAVAPYKQVELFYNSPMKIIEYLAMGKAILTSRMGQNEELIRHGECGLLYDPDDYEAMLRHLNLLIRDAELRKRLQRGAEMRSRELCWTWEANAKTVLGMCDRALPKV